MIVVKSQDINVKGWTNLTTKKKVFCGNSIRKSFNLLRRISSDEVIWKYAKLL
jgi:hypothetical protein